MVRNTQFYKRKTGLFGLVFIGFTCLAVVVIFLYVVHDDTLFSKNIQWFKNSAKRNLTNFSPIRQSVLRVNKFVERTDNVTGEGKYGLIPPNFIPDDNTKQISFQCKETFNKTLEDNLKVIANYPRGNADEYLFKLGANKIGPDKLRTFPVFVTAFDSKYYFAAQGLIKSIHERFLANPKYSKDVHIIVFDLGMTSLQYTKVKRNCKCEIRRFPFEKFSPHVKKLKTYAFKPIILQMLLMEFGFVWWMDSSIRFLTDNFDPALTYAKKYGILHTVSTDNRNSCALTKHTHNATFDFFREDRCKFRPFAEIWATTVMFHYDRVSRVAVEAWVTCALNENCIAPTGSEKMLRCDYKKDYDGRCHRFDQSVLGIITRRIFHEQNRYPLDYSLNSIYIITRGEVELFFV